MLREGVPRSGMPAFNDMPEPELRALIGFLKTLVPPAAGVAGADSRRASKSSSPTANRSTASPSAAPAAKFSCAPTISGSTF